MGGVATTSLGNPYHYSTGGVGGPPCGRDCPYTVGVVEYLQSSGFRVQGSGFRVEGSGFRVQGSGWRVPGVQGSRRSRPPTRLFSSASTVGLCPGKPPLPSEEGATYHVLRPFT